MGGGGRTGRMGELGQSRVGRSLLFCLGSVK